MEQTLKTEDHKEASPIAALMEKKDDGTAFFVRKLADMRRQNSELISQSQEVTRLTQWAAAG